MNSCADGTTYDHARDHDRLTQQRGRVLWEMQDLQWHTLRELANATGDPEASVSARLRDFRKKKFGSYIIEREYAGDGLWRYRLGG